MTRRHFLTAAACAVAAGAKATELGMQLNLSCGALGIHSTQQQAIEWAGKFGFDVVDADGSYLARIPDADRARLLDSMKSLHVGWATAGVPFEYREDESAFTAGMKDLPEYAEGLRRAGVERVTTWIMPSHATRAYPANLKLHAQRLRAIAHVLADNNLRFGLEYVAPQTLLLANRYPFVHTMAEMKELIAEIAALNVGMVLDSWHWYHAGDTADDLLSLKPPEVVSVDLNDAPSGIEKARMIDGARELPAATGVIDVKTFLGSLHKIGYQGPVRAEPFNKVVQSMPPEQAIAAAMAALRKAFAEAAS